MVDLEAAADLGGGIADEQCVAGVPRHDEVHGERRLGRAHRPDVEVVHGDHARQLREELLDLTRIDVRGHDVEQEAQRVAQEADCPDEDHDGDHEAGHRVDPAPAGLPHDDAGDYDASRDRGVADQVQERAADVDVASRPRANSSAAAPLIATPIAATTATMPPDTG